MNSRTRLGGLSAAALAALVLAASPGFAAGFGLFEQGAKAMGMAGAFTAQADDPSALFHNAGGLAFLEEGSITAGLTYFHATKADFQGAAPYPGPNAKAEQKLLSEFIPHGYWIRPLNQRWKFGFGVEAPFGLTTEWENENTFPGRFLSTKAALRVVDLNPTLGWKLTDNFGVGFGFISRWSDVELNRHIAAVNPFTLAATDVGKLNLQSDFADGYGWNVGILHKYNNSFSWGLSYRSRVEVNYEGDARLSQISSGDPRFDAVVRTRLPFATDLPVKTAIDFPDMASLGFALALGPTSVVEVDVNWTGWKSFDVVPIEFTGTTSANSLPDAEIPEHWEDAYNYRIGFRWDTSATGQWRFGYVYDETPQPEEAISPLLPDANRNGITLGYGMKGRINSDFALMYLKFDERSRQKSFAGEGPYFGSYNTTAVLLSATFSF